MPEIAFFPLSLAKPPRTFEIKTTIAKPA